MQPALLARWHALLESADLSGLDALVAAEAIFESPIVHTPQVGKALTCMYLATAAKLLNNGSFRYVNEWISERSAALEFEASVDGIAINGIDLIHWNDADQIVRFKVMVRPLKAIQLLQQRMAQALAKPSL